MFRRRDRKPFLRAAWELIWPRGGWARAFHYVRHRVRRLPDSPEKISRGIWAGLFTTFTPFYGLHFVVAGVLAWIMRGNILAALLATFFGNPLSYVPIGIVSLKTGYFLLGLKPEDRVEASLTAKFVHAGEDLWANFLAIFTHRTADWTDLRVFYDEVFFPYMIGGILPGIFVGTVGYYLSAPLIRAYQARRKGTIRARFEALRKKPQASADETGEAE